MSYLEDKIRALREHINKELDEILEIAKAERNPLFDYMEQVDASTDPLSTCVEFQEGLPCEVCEKPIEMKELSPESIEKGKAAIHGLKANLAPPSMDQVTFNCTSCKKLSTNKTHWQGGKYHVECKNCGNIDEL
jgi:hypothetical protein